MSNARNEPPPQPFRTRVSAPVELKWHRWHSYPAHIRQCAAVRELVLALAACYACMKCMQYTIRNVPEAWDSALRRRAREQGKSLNEVAIEALARGAGLTEHTCRQRDLSDIAGSWKKDLAFESVLASQDTIDPDLWR